MCHIPSSYVFVVGVDRALVVVDFGGFASAGCAVSAARFEVALGMETVGMEIQVKVEDRVGVEVEDEDAYSRPIMLVEVWLVGSVVDDDVGVSAGLTTMYDKVVVGEGCIVIS